MEDDSTTNNTALVQKYSTIKAQNYKATKSIIRIKSNSVTSVSESITAAILSCKVKLFRTWDLDVQVLLLQSYLLSNQMLIRLQKSQTNFKSLLFPTSTQTSCAHCTESPFLPLLLALLHYWQGNKNTHVCHKRLGVWWLCSIFTATINFHAGKFLYKQCSTHLNLNSFPYSIPTLTQRCRTVYMLHVGLLIYFIYLFVSMMGYFLVARWCT